MESSTENVHPQGALVAVGAVLLCLLPFISKAFNVDDPLFIWAAKHIQSHPADCFGFEVNWYGWAMLMADVTKNPPGACYYLALVGRLFGWSEISLHLAFLLPAAAAAYGTYVLAVRWTAQPLLATLLGLLTPVFIVSSTSVMSDTMMLAFWVWALVFWIQGLKEKRPLLLIGGALLIAACALTKYFGMTLIPLLFVYSIIEKRSLKSWIGYLLIPLALLAAYQYATEALYGRGLLTDAASYASQVNLREGRAPFSQGLIGLAFIGGCVVTGLFYLPLLGSLRWLVGLAVSAVSLLIFLLVSGTFGKVELRDADGTRWAFVLQVVVLTVGGLNLMALVIADLWKHRSNDSLLLFLWILGTALFASQINWTINARSILPMVPAAGIVLARRFDQRFATATLASRPRRFWPLIPAVVIALLVGWSDFRWSNASRDAAVALGERLGRAPGTLWFQGHWGFQYYMEAAGFQAVDFKDPKMVRGDRMVVPLSNTNVEPLAATKFRVTGFHEAPVFRWMSTSNSRVGAGFYAHTRGPIPYAFGEVPAERYGMFDIY